MTSYELPIAAERFTKDYYYKNNSDYIDMHEASGYFNYENNLFLVAGLTGEPNVVVFALVEWRSHDWYGVREPIYHNIVQNGRWVTAYNNNGRIGFNAGGIYFVVIPLRA